MPGPPSGKKLLVQNLAGAVETNRTRAWRNQADAPGLGPGPRKGVGVQVPPLALALNSTFDVNSGSRTSAPTPIATIWQPKICGRVRSAPNCNRRGNMTGWRSGRAPRRRRGADRFLSPPSRPAPGALRVGDNFGPGSDVDLLVEFDPGRVPGVFSVAAMELELACRRPGGDLRTAEDLSPHFRDEVRTSAVSLYP
jgi:hypothetical protein